MLKLICYIVAVILFALAGLNVKTPFNLQAWAWGFVVAATFLM